MEPIPLNGMAIELAMDDLSIVDPCVFVGVLSLAELDTAMHKSLAGVAIGSETASTANPAVYVAIVCSHEAAAESGSAGNSSAGAAAHFFAVAWRIAETHLGSLHAARGAPPGFGLSATELAATADMIEVEEVEGGEENMEEE